MVFFQKFRSDTNLFQVPFSIPIITMHDDVNIVFFNVFLIIIPVNNKGIIHITTSFHDF